MNSRVLVATLTGVILLLAHQVWVRVVRTDPPSPRLGVSRLDFELVVSRLEEVADGQARLGQELTGVRVALEQLTGQIGGLSDRSEIRAPSQDGVPSSRHLVQGGLTMDYEDISEEWKAHIATRFEWGTPDSRPLVWFLDPEFGFSIVAQGPNGAFEEHSGLQEVAAAGLAAYHRTNRLKSEYAERRIADDDYLVALDSPEANALSESEYDGRSVISVLPDGTLAVVDIRPLLVDPGFRFWNDQSDRAFRLLSTEGKSSGFCTLPGFESE